jgi:O-antigen ligase
MDAIRIPGSIGAVPSPLVEYTYYASLFYSVMATPLGISVGMLGAATMAALAVICFMRIGRGKATLVLQPLVLPLCCGISFLAVQLLAHGAFFTQDYVRDCINWIVALIVIQSLTLREGFLHRFAAVAFALGLMTLPYLQVFDAGTDYTRLGLGEGVGSANPNALAAWFGFCALYFIIKGIETRRTYIRIVVWAFACGCLYVIALTVSRGALVALAPAVIIAFRRFLKRGFLPVLILGLSTWIVYLSGLFDQAGTSYAVRATEESGRFLVWPLAFERFLDSPLVGVGASNAGTYIADKGTEITPHNCFLFLALASGIAPLLFFVGYVARSAWGVWRSLLAQMPEAPFLLPFYVYMFLIILTSNIPFMEPWAIVVLCAGMRVESVPRVSQRSALLGRHPLNLGRRHTST